MQKWNPMIIRDIQEESLFMLSQFRALCVTGPRQSGKTTLSKMLFKGKPYISFEAPQTQSEADKDMAAFVKKYSKGAIFDEVQRVPDIFRQLQGILDKNTRRGQFLLTGSNNFLLQEQISQSLAGRAGYIELLPLSYSELHKAALANEDIATHLISGGYPEIWNESLAPFNWMQAYVQTYVQRDVRLLKNITSLATFRRFLSICAHYAGQIINRDEMSRQVGVDTKTILAWLGVLESSYIVYLLQPRHTNLNKRVIKSPKLYFYDTGLLCYLLGLSNATALKRNAQYGAIFENWVISELRKNRSNAGIYGGLYFFRDSAGNEIDVVMEKNGEIFGIEIKSTKKPGRDDLRGLLYWKKQQPASKLMLIHGGTKEDLANNELSWLPWQQVQHI